LIKILNILWNLVIVKFLFYIPEIKAQTFSQYEVTQGQLQNTCINVSNTKLQNACINVSEFALQKEQLTLSFKPKPCKATLVTITLKFHLI